MDDVLINNSDEYDRMGFTMDKRAKYNLEALAAKGYTGDVYSVQVKRYDPIKEQWEHVCHPIEGLYLSRTTAEEQAESFSAAMATEVRDASYPMVTAEVQLGVWLNGELVENGYVTRTRDYLVDGTVVDSYMAEDADPHIWYDYPLVLLDNRPEQARAKLVR